MINLQALHFLLQRIVFSFNFVVVFAELGDLGLQINDFLPCLDKFFLFHGKEIMLVGIKHSLWLNLTFLIDH